MSDAVVDQLHSENSTVERARVDLLGRGMLFWKLREACAPVSLERGAALCHERQRNDYVAILESGLCVAIKRTRDGHQQNVAIYVPGDVLDHETFTLGAATSTIVAMTPVLCHRLSMARLRGALEQDRDLAEAFWRYVAFQGALAQEWMLGLGRRPALERTAHLLCELVFRMRAPDRAATSRATCR